MLATMRNDEMKSEIKVEDADLHDQQQRTPSHGIMRMWRGKIFYVVLGLIPLGVARESIWIRPRFVLSQDAQVGLSKMPGNIEIKFASDKIWTYTIANGQLLMRNVKQYEPGWMERRPASGFGGMFLRGCLMRCLTRRWSQSAENGARFWLSSLSGR